MRKLRRTRMPASQADATVEIAEDATRRLVTTEQFEATLYRALIIQGAVIIITIVAIMTAIMAVLLLVFPAP